MSQNFKRIIADEIIKLVIFIAFSLIFSFILYHYLMDVYFVEVIRGDYSGWLGDPYTRSALIEGYLPGMNRTEYMVGQAQIVSRKASEVSFRNWMFFLVGLRLFIPAIKWINENRSKS